MTKQEIRARSEKLGLKNSDRPAQPCLASRLMYGTSVTSNNLRVVELMEDCLIKLGFIQCRARYDGTTVRIEVPSNELEKAVRKEIREELTRSALNAGALYVSLDLEGFASGKTNRMLFEKND
jgi:uncharacterized protein